MAQADERNYKDRLDRAMKILLRSRPGLQRARAQKIFNRIHAQRPESLISSMERARGLRQES